MSTFNKGTLENGLDLIKNGVCGISPYNFAFLDIPLKTRSKSLKNKVF
jgi:hypothetical protein